MTRLIAGKLTIAVGGKEVMRNDGEGHMETPRTKSQRPGSWLPLEVSLDRETPVGEHVS